MKRPMKRWAAVLICLIFLAGPGVQAAPSTISVCGEATAGTGDEARALDNARYKAVRKALMHIIPPSEETQSLFQTVLRQYRSFSDMPTIIKRQGAVGRLYLISKVAVNMDTLEGAVRSGVRAENNKKEDGTVYFFVRVSGLAQKAEEKTENHKVLQIYNAAFQRLGFTTADEDAQLQRLAVYQSMPYEAFCQAVENDLKENVEVTMAAIGKIDVAPRSSDAVGVTDEGHIRVKVIDLVQGRQVAEFYDAYAIRRASRAEADDFILDKSAFNSAKVLADQTLAYWKKGS